MRAHLRTLIAVCATALIAALALVAAPAGGAPTSPARPAFPPDRPTRVLVLGDSVMLGAKPQDEAALPGRDVTVDAAVNRSTNQGAEKVAELGTDWDVVVVLLGHNDGGTPSVYQPAARKILDQLKDVPRVVWLTIHESRPYYKDVNAFMASLQKDYPNLEIGDWNKIANEHPEAMSGDGLHLKPEGSDLMADLVAQEVTKAENELGPNATTTTTAPPTTTTAATTTGPDTLSAVTTPPTEQTTGQTSSATDSKDDDDPPVALIGGAVTAVLFVAGIVIGIRLSRRRAVKREADTAG